jgi:hypothetical protein
MHKALEPADATVSARVALLVLVLLVAGLGGCAGKGAGPAAVGAPGTGQIHGVVVDPAVRPLAGATVVADGQGVRLNSTTGADGLFAFAGLAPGNYVLSINKTFYIGAQTTAQVVADAAGPIVKVELSLETGTLPFANSFKWDGFIECSASIGNWCGIANLYPCIVERNLGQPCGKISNDQSFVFLDRFFLDVQRIPAWIQQEAYWESTQSFSATLGIRFAATNQSEWDQFSYGPVMDNVIGPSPLISWAPGEPSEVGYMANGTAMNESGLGLKRGMTTELFHGRLDAAPRALEQCTPQTPLGKACWGNQFLGVAASQRISIVYMAFYGYRPPPGWSLAASGEIPPPS